ncbi:MAG: hypothetical protein AAF657_20000 [Acidobacteriota bacterium]
MAHLRTTLRGPLVAAVPAVALLAGVALPAGAQTDDRLADFAVLFGLAELPFLFLAVFCALATAGALKGGAFGRGMRLIAGGFMVMAVGHLHMLIERMMGINLFASLFGVKGGAIVWIIALIASWTLSWLGFHSMYKAGKAS